MASTFPFVRAVRVVMCAGGVLGLPLPAAAQAQAPAPAAQAATGRGARGARQASERVRGRARRLWRAARGARGKADGAWGRQPAPAVRRARWRQRRPRSRSLPARPGPAGRRGRFRFTATPARCRRSSTPTWRSSATSSARPARTPSTPARRSRWRKPKRRSRRSSIRTRGRTSSWPFSPEGVEIEEGFLTLTSLPGGLLAKVGKLKQQVGKVNTLHAHSLPWVDKPLMIQNLFGGDEGLSDSGVSVSKLILNPFLFLEATGEVYAGSSGLFTVARAERRELGRTASRLSRRHRIDQRRHRRVRRLRAQRR